MKVLAVFLPKDPEAVMFDVVESVDRSVRAGCKLHVRRRDQLWAFLPPRRDPLHWHKAGWDLFGLHRKEPQQCAPASA